MLRGIFYAIISGAQSAPRLQIKNGAAFAAIPIGNFGKGRPLKKRAGVA